MLYQIWTSVIFLINVNPDFQWPYEFELSLIKLRYAINKYALHELCEPSNNYDMCKKLKWSGWQLLQTLVTRLMEINRIKV